jgi:tRNA dimethylallyltransferase
LKVLLVIGGPTASGKTRFAITLAQQLNAPILSADSRQFYQEMSIGTAKPDARELAAAPHHFIGHLSIEEAYSVGDYERDAIAFLEEHYQQHDYAILVGGSGLYLKAVCEGLNAFPDVPEELKKDIEREYDLHGLAHLQKAVAESDPIYFAQVDQQNPHRLMRALSVIRASGQPFSSFWEQALPERSFTPIYIQLQWPRQSLYERINKRVDQMIAHGLEEEAKSLIPYQHHKALQTVGYQEFFDFFSGQTSKEEAIALIKRNSRRYAKRQMTWYRRDGLWKLMQADETEFALQYIQSVLQHDIKLNYIPIKAHLYPVKSDKCLQLNITKQEETIYTALIFQRRQESMIIITQSLAKKEDSNTFFIHEISLLHIDFNAYILAPESLVSTFSLKQVSAPLDWMQSSWETLQQDKTLQEATKDKGYRWYAL